MRSDIPGNAAARSIDRLRGAGRGPVLRVALAVAVAVGLALRLRQMMVGRSLWMDEAMLALNVVSRPFSGLFEPLDYNQGAPVGFLVLQKLASLALGETDTAMRVVPLAASCAALVLFARAAVAWTGPVAAVVATALFALATPLVDYSSEAKQYAVDVAATVGVLHLLSPWAAGRAAGPRDWARLALVGALLPWLSHPAAFVLAGAGFVVLVRSVRAGAADHEAGLPGRDAVRSVRDGAAGLARVAAVASTWGLSVAALYGLSLRSLSANAALTGYWKHSFAPLGEPHLAEWTQQMVLAWLRDVSGLGDGVLMLAALALGLVSLLVRRADLALALVAPMVLALVASGFELYPFSGRLLLFAVPLAMLLAAEGARVAVDGAGAAVSRLVAPGVGGNEVAKEVREEVRKEVGEEGPREAGFVGSADAGRPASQETDRWSGRVTMEAGSGPRRAAAIVEAVVFAAIAAALLHGPARSAWNRLLEPRNPEALRPALEQMLARRAPDEAVYVYYGAKPAWNFYARGFSIPADLVVLGRAHRADPKGYRDEVAQVLGRGGGAWVVLSHNCPVCRVDEWQVILDQMDAGASAVEAFRGPGAEVHHYRFDPR